MDVETPRVQRYFTAGSPSRSRQASFERKQGTTNRADDRSPSVPGQITGYHEFCALGARTLLMPLLIAAVILLIYDLTHPSQGVIGISQRPLLELRESMNEDGEG